MCLEFIEVWNRKLFRPSNIKFMRSSWWQRHSFLITIEPKKFSSFDAFFMNSSTFEQRKSVAIKVMIWNNSKIKFPYIYVHWLTWNKILDISKMENNICNQRHTCIRFKQNAFEQRNFLLLHDIDCCEMRYIDPKRFLLGPSFFNLVCITLKARSSLFSKNILFKKIYIRGLGS